MNGVEEPALQLQGPILRSSSVLSASSQSSLLPQQGEGREHNSCELRRMAADDRIDRWLAELGLEARVQDFKREHIDVEALSRMDHDHLRSMGIVRLGDRLKLLGRAADQSGEQRATLSRSLLGFRRRPAGSPAGPLPAGEPGASFLDASLPSGRGFSDDCGRTKNSVIQAQDQCNAHLLPSVLLCSLSAGAVFSVGEVSTLAQQWFLVMAVASTCLEFAATFMLVLSVIYYSTPGGEAKFRGFDVDVSRACICFQLGGHAFLACLPLKALCLLHTTEWVTTAVTAMASSTSLLIVAWFTFSASPRYQEAFEFELDTLREAPPGFRGSSPLSLVLPVGSFGPVHVRMREMDGRDICHGVFVFFILSVVPRVASWWPVFSCYS
jgi:hypothetical protein